MAPEESREQDEAGEDVPALLRRVIDERGGNASAVARALGVNVGTFNSWTNGTRMPTGENLRKLAAGTGISEATWVAAAGRKVPAELDEEREQRILKMWRSFSAEEQVYAEGSWEGLQAAKARAESQK